MTGAVKPDECLPDTGIWNVIDQEEKDMLDFDEELKNFTKNYEVDQTEDAIYSNDLKDITDIVAEMTKDLRGNR